MNLMSLFSLCNATPQRHVNARRQRKRFIHNYLFSREMGKTKKDKKKSCDGAGDRERYVSSSSTDLLLAGKGPGPGSWHRVFGPIKHNNTARTIGKPLH